MTTAFAKQFEGFLIEQDPKTMPKALAELFCNMMADEQAQFLNMVQRLSSEWPNNAVFQWRSMEDHLEPAAREMLQAMLDHTEREPA